jgi:hypothetical protein
MTKHDYYKGFQSAHRRINFNKETFFTDFEKACSDLGITFGALENEIRKSCDKIKPSDRNLLGFPLWAIAVLEKNELV